MTQTGRRPLIMALYLFRAELNTGWGRGRHGGGREDLRAASWTKVRLGWQLAFGSSGEQSWMGLLPPNNSSCSNSPTQSQNV